MPTKPRLKNTILLTTFFQSPSPPSEVRLREHSLPVEGPTGNGTWLGAHGKSAQQALWRISTNPMGSKGHYQTVRTWLPATDLSASNVRPSLQEVEHTGYLHLGRVKVAFLRDLRDLVIERLKAGRHGTDADLQDLTMDELTSRYPISTQFLLSALPPVNVVVASMRLKDSGHLSVWTGAVRCATVKAAHSEVNLYESQCDVRW